MNKPLSIVGVLLCVLIATNAGANDAAAKKKHVPRRHASRQIETPAEPAVPQDRDPDIVPGASGLRDLYRSYGCGAFILISKPYPCRVPFEE